MPFYTRARDRSSVMQLTTNYPTKRSINLNSGRPKQLLFVLQIVQLTTWLLEAVTPLIVGKLSIFEGVTGVEERFDAWLILIQINGTDL